MASVARRAFTIIIPTFNYGAYVSRAVDSALSQVPDRECQIVVVDDGSTDDTPIVAGRYGDRICYIRKLNEGVSVARNRGIEAARHEWIVFLDADDRLLSEALHRFDESIARHPEIKLHFGHYVSTDQHGESTESRPSPPMAEPLENFRRFIQRDFVISTGTACYHRSVFDRVRFPVGLTHGQDVVVDGQVLALFPAITFPHPVAEIFSHDGRNRDSLERFKRCGIATVEAMFNPDVLPPEALRLKPLFLARWYLTLARTCYRSRDYTSAASYYEQAAAAQWTSLLSTRHLARYVKSWLRASWKRASQAGCA
jgi:glycosyltransferase involved in cell wall biosynthesis